MGEFKGWQKLERLGEGGQGEVFKARSPERHQQLQNLHEAIRRGLSSAANSQSVNMSELLDLISGATRSEDAEYLGALKVLKLPNSASQHEKALGRLKTEIETLQKISHPAVLKLIDSDLDERFMVTEFHENGTLLHKLDEYKGRALEALLAFRPLVEAVGLIHQNSAVHRDIKLENIFVADDRHLVLGDFGIVLVRDASGRMTETYERVGSRDWMAPWANTGQRLALEDVNTTLDIYPLGKVLWCMVSGRHGLPFWYYNRPENNLEQLFPGNAEMRSVNEILAKCVVEDEEDCLKSADELLALVDQTIENLRWPERQPRDGSLWPCLICGKGYYEAPPAGSGVVLVAEVLQVHEKLPCGLRICGSCGHCQMFADMRSLLEFRVRRRTN
jgi:serine/threonine protein kinase